ncbi:MAG TPA: aldose 1-epimerase [Casimicrobiaceae bacterium]
MRPAASRDARSRNRVRYSLARSIVTEAGDPTIVELAAPSARVAIAPEVGCAVTAFTVGGHAVLRPTPPAAIAGRDVRQTSCYPLVPYSNRIRGARLRFGGREYALARNFGTHPHAIHGVGWQRAWSVAGASQGHARFTLHHDAQGERARAWPWPFVATQTFHLAERDLPGEAPTIALAVTLTIANTGGEAFPFGLGWHPFFPRDATTHLGFRADAVWRNDATQLPRQHVPVAGEWRFDPPRSLDAIALDNVFTGWRGFARVETAAAGLAATLEADRACSCLVVYVPSGGDFAAVEPVTHETDAFNRAAAGAQATGLRVLPPGAAFSCTMRIAAAAIAGSGSRIAR